MQIAAGRVSVTAIGVDDQAHDIGPNDAKAHHTRDTPGCHSRVPCSFSLSPAAVGQAAAVSSFASS